MKPDSSNSELLSSAAIAQNPVQSWNGQYTVLHPANSEQTPYEVSMMQTPNVLTLLTWKNQTQGNNGKVSVTYGGNALPSNLTSAPAGLTSPSGVFWNFSNNNLNVSNQSTQTQPYVMIATAAGGPGLGIPTSAFPIGRPVSLLPWGAAGTLFSAASGYTTATMMSVTLTAGPAGAATVFAVYIGGNPYTFQTPTGGASGGAFILNLGANPGFINVQNSQFSVFTTTESSYQFQGNFFGQQIWIANLSPVGGNMQPATVLMTQM